MSKDPARLVVMHRQNVGFPVTGLGSKEQRDNGLKVLGSCCRALVDSRRVVMTKKIENEIDGLHAGIVRLVAAPQIKATVFKTLSVTQESIVLCRAAQGAESQTLKNLHLNKGDR